MTARTLGVVTFVLPPEQRVNPTLQPVQANASVSFELTGFTKITTLSSNLANVQNGQVEGLLYVPSIDPSDTCYNLSEAVVPKNVTRRANIPTTEYSAIAIAPWINADCTRLYLRSTQQDVEFLRGLIFFQVNDTSEPNASPPPVSDPVWGLNDGGQWKSQLGFPAYAVPGVIGRLLMTNLGIYSGNVTTVPDGDALAPDFGPGGMPRLYSVFVTDGGPSLPSLWVFLIIVLGILLSIVTGSSLFMGFVQRRRRQALRRRVENGEVDLESLGIKRMTVPQAQIDKMPLYIFKGDHTTTNNDSAANRDVQATDTPHSGESRIDGNTPMAAPAALPAQNGQFFSQTVCTICLDDYVSNETTVRELPCHHIFHPECVDTFLLEHSSACPVCKKSTLPDGFCPENITNAMVRREQLIRRIQERRGSRAVTAISGGAIAASNSDGRQVQQRRLNEGDRIGLASRVAGLRELISVRVLHRHEADGENRQPSQSNLQPTTNPSVEMATLPPSSLSPDTDTPSPPAPTANSANPFSRASIMALHTETDSRLRRALGRQRAIANLNRQNAAVEQDIASEEQRLPMWRRAVGRVWPGYTSP